MELIESFVRFITEYQDYSYGVILIILLASGAGLPLSKDALLIASGIIAGIIAPYNENALTLMLLSCIFGVTAGDCIMFYLGRMLSFRIQRYWPFSRIITPKRFAALRKYYRMYGLWFIVIARFIPVIRIPLYIFCGMTRKIKIGFFILINGAVSVIYTVIWVGLGYICTRNRELLLEYIPKINFGFIALALTLILGLLAYHRFRFRSERKKQ